MATLNQSEKKSLTFGAIFGRWEVTLILLIIIVSIVCTSLSPYFLDVTNLFNMTTNFMEKAVMALPMAFVIIIGAIDLSVASNLALSSIIMGLLYQGLGLPIWVAMIVGLIVGTFGGFINGILIGKVKLPALAATLGTYALYRGLCYSFIGDQTVANFPDSFLNIGLGTIGSTPIPVQLVIFLVFAVIYGLLLHRTTFGRFTYAIGQNEEGCRFSGVPVDRTKIIIFSLNGLMAAVAGIILAARFTSVRVDAGLGYELDVITAVVLGGVDIAGGSGTIFGVVLSLFLLGLIRYGMSLLNISGQIQSIAVGCMLIIAILVPYVTRQIRQKTRKQQLVE